jgi:hypothetical protein
MQKNALTNGLCAFQLKPLTMHETKHYLKKILWPALPREKRILGKLSLEKIYTLSEGYMGRINRVVHQLLIEHERKTPTSYQAPKRRTSWVDIVLVAGIILLLIVVVVRIWMLSFQVVNPKPPAAVVASKAEPLSYIASIKNLPETRLALPTAQQIILPAPVSGGLE